jgi:hypothetical protein
MLRGMHYMCWYRNDWNYHPSMPMKRLQQVQDIVDMKGTHLFWSCMGSGAIGLQYLDKEINESIPPRLRFYGYLNDREFVAECTQRGIVPFAVVWMAQLWEFPAEFNEDETELLSMNKLRGVGKPGWVGMHELSTDRYPKIFSSIKNYFPDGIINSDGKLVVDFLEEFRSVTLDGKPIESTWLLVPGHDHHCYTPCGNNPAYLQYLKREMEMMIDAGAPGILLDEFNIQVHAFWKGGCFCKDCMKGFREYLQEHPCEETKTIQLATFDYRVFLMERGYCDSDLLGGQADLRWEIPLFRQFLLFNLRGVDRTMGELTSYAKEYSAAKRGKPILMSINLFNCLPHAGMVRRFSDIIGGEKSNIKLRQDGHYRLCHAFCNGKPGSFIEDPNQHIFQIIKDIDACKYDTYRLFMLEPLAQGFNVAISYGGWLMNYRKDSFYPPLEVEKQLGSWLNEHEGLFTNRLVAKTAILYDHRSALYTESFLSGHLDREKVGGFQTFDELSQALCDERILYKVLFVADDQPLTAKALSNFENLIIPDAFSLKDEEIETILTWVNRGGRAVAVGKVDRRLANLRFSYFKFADLEKWIFTNGHEVETDAVEGVGLAIHQCEDGRAIHLVNYRLNTGTREIDPIEKMELKLDWQPAEVTVYSFPEDKYRTEVSASGNTLTVKNIGLYTILHIQ